jgi:hypothetical protein
MDHENITANTPTNNDHIVKVLRNYCEVSHVKAIREQKRKITSKYTPVKRAAG